jgi:hypothetical protein
LTAAARSVGIEAMLVAPGLAEEPQLLVEKI